MQSSWFYEIADLFLQPEVSAALANFEGEVLHSKSNLGFETTGFRATVESSLKYIAAKPGDVVLTNDPYSGGSFLHRYNFLLVLASPSPSSPGFVLCVRRDFSPRLNPCDRLDEEGLRIPPTPIYQGDHVMTPIIEAMSMHPLCAEGFSTWLQSVTTELNLYFTKWQNLEKSLKLPFSTPQIKKFLNFSNHFATEKISERGEGEGRSEVRLDSGEVIKLRLEIHNGLVKADFGGTSPGFKCHLPDGATFGACYDALSEFYNLQFFRNSGTFSILQVTKPLGCFLNAKYPSSAHRGLQSGVAAVKLAMNMALRQIVKTSQALNTESELRLEMVFPENRRWLSQWTPKASGEALSIENVEATYPIEFIKFEKNLEKASMHVEFKTLQPCQLRWHSDFTLHAPRLPAPWKATSVGLLETQTLGSEWAKLSSQGNTDIAPGTTLRIQLWGQFERAEKAPV